MSAQAQPPAATPGAEQKNLARFVGTWKMEGTMEPSPLAPKGGTFTGTESCSMFEGWHLVCESSGSGAMGAMKSRMMMSYDRNAKTYRYFAVSTMPDAETATGTLEGTTWTWTGSMEQGGQKVHTRFTLIEKSPTVHTFSMEMSMDGHKWMPAMKGTSTKAGS
jgi:hypothetical protein